MEDKQTPAIIAYGMEIGRVTKVNEDGTVEVETILSELYDLFTKRPELFGKLIIKKEQTPCKSFSSSR